METSDLLLHEDEYCSTESLLNEVPLNYWRLQGARNLESQSLEQDRENEKLLALYARYRTALERSFYGALYLLRKVKAENTRLITCYRGLSPDGRPLPRFVSQKPFDTQSTADSAQEEAAA